MPPQSRDSALILVSVLNADVRERRIPDGEALKGCTHGSSSRRLRGFGYGAREAAVKQKRIQVSRPADRKTRIFSEGHGTTDAEAMGSPAPLNEVGASTPRPEICADATRHCGANGGVPLQD